MAVKGTIDLVCAECNKIETVTGDAQAYIGYALIKFQRLCDVCLDKPDREEE